MVILLIWYLFPTAQQLHNNNAYTIIRNESICRQNCQMEIDNQTYKFLLISSNKNLDCLGQDID